MITHVFSLIDFGNGCHGLTCVRDTRAMKHTSFVPSTACSGLLGPARGVVMVVCRLILKRRVVTDAAMNNLHAVTVQDQLSSLCDTLDNFTVEYEDLCPHFHWGEQVASGAPYEHPLYRTKRCLHGSFEQCPMRGMCPFAHTGDQMRPMPSLETQHFSYKLRLRHLGREIFTCETHGIFRDQNSAMENAALQCIDYIDHHDDSQCIICTERPRASRLGCGHSCMCEDCLARLLLLDRGSAKCPICRARIIRSDIRVDPCVAHESIFLPMHVPAQEPQYAPFNSMGDPNIIMERGVEAHYDAEPRSFPHWTQALQERADQDEEVWSPVDPGFSRWPPAQEPQSLGPEVPRWVAADQAAWRDATGNPMWSVIIAP
jgi:hypothetical protein